jgi:signal transduction histidine kinase
MISIKRRLVIHSIISSTLLLAIAGFFIYKMIENQLYANFYKEFDERIETYSMMVELDEKSGFITEWSELKLAAPLGMDTSSEHVSIWLPEGKLIEETPPLNGIDASSEIRSNNDLPDINGSLIRRKKSIYAQFDGSDKESEKLSDLVAENLKTPLTIIYTRVDNVSPILGKIKQVVFFTWLAASIIFVFLLTLVVKKNLNPLAVLQEKISTLKDSCKSEIHIPNAPTEIEPIITELNELFARINTGIDREKRLSSNIAHELKTPLAGLQTMWEVTLNRERQISEYEQAGETSLEITEQMSKLVNNLLSLAQLERGDIQLNKNLINISQLLTSKWSPHAKAAEQKGLRIAWDIDETFTYKTDEVLLSIIISNVFDNLVTYAKEKGKAHISLSDKGHLRIGNETEKLSSELSKRIFDPLWRQSQSRTSTGVHAGIGMSLSKNIANILKLELTAATSSSDGWLEINLTLPASS